MTTFLTITEPATPRKRHSLRAADLAMFPNTVASGSMRYELRDGNLVVMALASAIHGRLHCGLGLELYRQGEELRLGRPLSRTGIVVRRSPDHVLFPDLMFFREGREDLKSTPEDYLESMPDLVVEIRDLAESYAELETKACDYLQAGAVIVWIVDHETRQIVVYRRDQPPVALRGTDALTAEDVIPTFRLEVEHFFRKELSAFDSNFKSQI